MPQFDVETFGPQLFWLVITFAMLFIIMHFWVVRWLDATMSERWENTEGHLKKSEDLMLEADALGRSYEEVINAAQEKAEEIRRAAQEKYYYKMLREREKITTQINFKLNAERRRIDKERQVIAQEITALTDELADHIVGQVQQSPWQRQLGG
jgi:F-type H+-transporting ATPase subunit b